MASFFLSLIILCIVSSLFAMWGCNSMGSAPAAPAQVKNTVIVNDTDGDCPLEKTRRTDILNDPFTNSNGNLRWLVRHPAYYYKSYHGYFPLSPDDYASYNPFDIHHPYFFN